MRPVAFASIVVRGVALWVLILGVAGLSLVLQKWPDISADKGWQIVAVLVSSSRARRGTAQRFSKRSRVYRTMRRLPIRALAPTESGSARCTSEALAARCCS